LIGLLAVSAGWPTLVKSKRLPIVAKVPLAFGENGQAAASKHPPAFVPTRE
jgi:hypothetical protein